MVYGFHHQNTKLGNFFILPYKHQENLEFDRSSLTEWQ